MSSSIQSPRIGFRLAGRLALLTLVSMTVACGARGSGTSATEVRELDPFTQIDLGGSFDVVVHVEPGIAQKLQITGDDNVLPKIETKVTGSELDIGLESNSMIIPKIPIRIEIWVPSLAAIEVSGAADITVDGIHGERFELDLSGASDSVIRGTVEQLDVRISGAGDLDAKALVADDVQIELSGAGDATVFANKSIDVDVSGAGNVVYLGDPSTVTSDISGSGSVDPG